MKRAGTFLAVATMLMSVAGTTAATTSAAAIVRETITIPFSESGVPDDCRPGITGDVRGTEVISYQSVETTTGYHVHGTDGGPGRIDWSDGTYSLIQSIDRFSFNVAGKGGPSCPTRRMSTRQTRTRPTARSSSGAHSTRSSARLWQTACSGSRSSAATSTSLATVERDGKRPHPDLDSDFELFC